MWCLSFLVEPEFALLCILLKCFPLTTRLTSPPPHQTRATSATVLAHSLTRSPGSISTRHLPCYFPTQFPVFSSVPTIPPALWAPSLAHAFNADHRMSLYSACLPACLPFLIIHFTHGLSSVASWILGDVFLCLLLLSFPWLPTVTLHQFSSKLCISETLIT